MTVDKKKLVPMLSTAVLGAVWLYLTYRHQPIPPALNQAIIAAAGSAFAGTALAGAIPKPKEAGNATTN
jgi:hypothetical protein